jgi:tetratricopeptide (TPR) repeat protein
VASACSIDTNSPKELAMASLSLQQARGAASADQRKKILTGVMKELDTKPERFAKNPGGYNYILSDALRLWGVEPGLPAAPPRAQLGLVTNPTAPYDIVVQMDSAYRRITAALPACATDVAALRQNEVWLANTQAALSASNGGQLDSAEYYARRSMTVSEANPYPYYVLANVANARNDRATAIRNWQGVIERAGSDSNYRDIKQGSMYYAGMSQLEQANGLQGAEQAAAAKGAAAMLQALLREAPAHPDAANIMNAWADALTVAKDTAAIPQVYAPLLADPAKASDLMLITAGVIASRLNRADDALALFEGAVARNPFARDALRNVAATYYGRDQFLKMFEPTRKLVAIDPNNYDAWMFNAYAAQGLMRAAKAPEPKNKKLPTPAELKAMAEARAQQKVWGDTLVKYQTIADGLPVKVDILEFSRRAEGSSVSISVEEKGATGGTHEVTMEFLDAAGTVVASDTQSTGALKKDEVKQLTFKGVGEKIIAFRYKPIK